MDTDDLSKKIYQAILLTAERFYRDLALRFGLLSYECSDEADYLIKAKALIVSPTAAGSRA
jgi:hypothetical protein